MKPPPPVIVQDDEARTAEGAAVSTHVTSAAKPVPVPLTTVPVEPVIGVRVKVGTGPAETVKLSVAESPEPAFVVTVTV
jgi:hypothetical protein